MGGWQRVAQQEAESETPVFSTRPGRDFVTRSASPNSDRYREGDVVADVRSPVTQAVSSRPVPFHNRERGRHEAASCARGALADERPSCLERLGERDGCCRCRVQLSIKRLVCALPRNRLEATDLARIVVEVESPGRRSEDGMTRGAPPS